MLVRERMTPNPVTVTPDTSVPEALRLMRERRIRRLPVVDGRGQLVGIVSDKDLLHVSPSPATSLAIWEIHDLVAKLKIDKVMTREVITVTEDTPIEDAARIMVDSRIGGMPVMKDKTLVGIITETDIFKAFLALLGGRRHGVRIAAYTPDQKGTVSRISTAVFEAGGNIVGLGLNDVPDDPNLEWEVTLKVQDVPKDVLVEVIQPLVHQILDVRET